LRRITHLRAFRRPLADGQPAKHHAHLADIRHRNAARNLEATNL